MFFNSRNEESEFLSRALSGDIRRMRRQRIRASIYISFLSWFLEFLLGSSAVILTIIRHLAWEDTGVDRWLGRLDFFVLFVVLPCTYIINSDKTKEMIVLKNWYQGIRFTFFPSVKVAPIGGPDHPPQSHEASVSSRNVGSSQDTPETLSKEEPNEEESPNPQTAPGISAQASETQPSAVLTNDLNSNDTFGVQLPKNIETPLSNVRVIQVKTFLDILNDNIN